ncbi:hypothetical protein BB558_004961 [Smittium angustum]|uniref:CDT1 Geminin-binding domain-containing protein n=1 Tax=Smittium angustum TaxID=133377 RepID=A0A2U1J1T4_SMIAN|nr:hypothetical protein BB558_004961 [Smittium angustum]
MSSKVTSTQVVTLRDFGKVTKGDPNKNLNLRKKVSTETNLKRKRDVNLNEPEQQNQDLGDNGGTVGSLLRYKTRSIAKGLDSKRAKISTNLSIEKISGNQTKLLVKTGVKNNVNTKGIRKPTKSKTESTKQHSALITKQNTSDASEPLKKLEKIETEKEVKKSQILDRAHDLLTKLRKHNEKSVNIVSQSNSKFESIKVSGLSPYKIDNINIPDNQGQDGYDAANDKVDKLLSEIKISLKTEEQPTKTLLERQKETDEIKQENETIRYTRAGINPTSMKELAVGGTSTFINHKNVNKVSKFIRMEAWPTKNKLPKNLQTLELTYQALEHTLAYVTAQGNSFGVFHRIKKWVENSSGHNFTFEQVGQIKYLFPTAYHFENTRINFEGKIIDSLIIAITDYKINDEHVNLSNPKDYVVAGMINPAVMEKRRNHFRKLLENHVLDAYNIWTEKASKVGYSLQKPNENLDSLKNWTFDKNFSLDLDVPLVPNALVGTSMMPKAAFQKDIINPKTDVKASSSGNNIPCSTEKPTNKETRAGKGGDKNGDSKTEKPVSRAKDLLERIRMKQLAAISKESEKNETVENMKSLSGLQVTRLCMMIDCMSYIFGIENTSILPLSIVLSKLQGSLDNKVNLSSTEINDLLRLLAEKVPEYLQLERINNEKNGKEFVRLRRTTSTNKVKQFLSGDSK